MLVVVLRVAERVQPLLRQQLARRSNSGAEIAVQRADRADQVVLAQMAADAAAREDRAETCSKRSQGCRRPT